MVHLCLQYRMTHVIMSSIKYVHLDTVRYSSTVLYLLLNSGSVTGGSIIILPEKIAYQCPHLISIPTNNPISIPTNNPISIPTMNPVMNEATSRGVGSAAITI